MKTNYKVAIVGATGLVGRTALRVLEERLSQMLAILFFVLQNLPIQKLIF